jgi:hypothetical protein
MAMELGGSDAAAVALFEMTEKDAAGIESGTAARAVEALRRRWMGQAMDQLRVRQTLRDGRLTRMSWRLSPPKFAQLARALVAHACESTLPPPRTDSIRLRSMHQQRARIGRASGDKEHRAWAIGTRVTAVDGR